MAGDGEKTTKVCLSFTLFAAINNVYTQATSNVTITSLWLVWWLPEYLFLLGAVMPER